MASLFSVGTQDFAAYRNLTGLGIGGEFAAGVALVAEVLPEALRTRALGALQVFGIAGTFVGTALSFFIKPEGLYFGHVPGWRVLFALGFLPAALLLLLRRGVGLRTGRGAFRTKAGVLWRLRGKHRRHTAGGALVLGQLVSLFQGLGYAAPLRPAAMALSSVYLIGIAVLPWLPETKGKPLPASP